MKINGIILVNKERNISSNKVVNKVKYILNADKAGHLGTLDVLGEGLLPITLGKGTKLFDYFLNKDKEYITIFKFGQTSLTLDCEGEIIENDKKVNITKSDILNVLPKLVGKQLQMPPIYSAKKINGKKAYDLARDGYKEIPLKAKEIEVYSIELISQIEKNTFKFKIHCSSGTYIRSLCRDLATLLGTSGIMLYIQRTKCGKFDIKNSYSLEDIQKGNYKVIKLDDVLDDYEKIYLSNEETQRLLNGNNIVSQNNGEFRAYNENEFLGLTIAENGYLRFKLRLI